MIEINLNNVILAPFHVFTGVASALVELLFKESVNSKQNLINRMSKLGVNYKFKPENLSGRQGLALMRKCDELLACLHQSNTLL